MCVIIIYQSSRISDTLNTHLFISVMVEYYCNVSRNSSLTIRLSMGLQDLDVHRRVDPTQDLSSFVSTVFVTGVDGACLPVSPIQGLLRQC